MIEKEDTSKELSLEYKIEDITTCFEPCNKS